MSIITLAYVGWLRGTSQAARVRLTQVRACHAGIDRSAFTRKVRVLGVSVEAADCATLMRLARPHVLRERGFKAVRPDTTDSRRRVVLLNSELQELTQLPSALRRVIDDVGGELHRGYHIDIGYEHHSVHEVLQELLPAGIEVPSGFESVGHLVHLNLRPEQLPHREIIGQAAHTRPHPDPPHLAVLHHAPSHSMAHPFPLPRCYLTSWARRCALSSTKRTISSQPSATCRSSSLPASKVTQWGPVLRLRPDPLGSSPHRPIARPSIRCHL